MSISVFITSFNQRDWLLEAIESVLNQTVKPDQIIVVDDCSNDGSQQLISRFANKYPHQIYPVFHSNNQGVTAARINALEKVTSNYVTYLDGDDRFLPNKIELEIDSIYSSDKVELAYSNNYYIDAAGSIIGKWIEDQNPPTGNIFLQTLARDFPRNNLFRMEMVNYNAWRQIGFHDPELHIYEDWDMRIRLTKKLFVSFVNEPLSKIRVHRTGLASSPADEHLLAFKHINNKYKPILNTFTREERAYVIGGMNNWKARLLMRKARELLKVTPNSYSNRLHAMYLIVYSMRYGVSQTTLRSFIRAVLPQASRLTLLA